MKNKILLLVGIISVIATTITSILFGNIANAASNLDDFDVEYEESLKRNWDMAVLATDIEKVINKHYNIVNRFSDDYPSFFGGLYINDEASAVVIQIVKDKLPKEESIEYQIYNEIVNFDKRIELVYVDYSFNELNNANNEVSDFMSSKATKISSKIMSNKSSNEMKNNIVGAYIDIINNTVVVEVEKEDENLQQKFNNSISKSGKSIADPSKHQLLTYKKGEMASTYRTLNAGSSIGYGCSMGFRTKRNGSIGYVTAGHCVEGKKSIDSGLVLDYQFYDNQKSDYAFILTNSDINLTNNLAYTGKNITKLAVVDYCPLLSTNLKIAKSGNATKYTDGKITGLNQTQKFKKEDGSVITLKGLVKSDLKATNGDSGGTVMIPKTDSQGGAVAIGVINGGAKGGFLNLSYNTYFTDINDMPMNLQARY